MSDRTYRILGAMLIAFVCALYMGLRHVEKMRELEIKAKSQNTEQVK